LEVKIVVNIQADEPLIHPTMIDSVARKLVDDPTVYMATLKTQIKDLNLVHDPNVVKVVTDRNDYALYFSRAPIPYLVKKEELPSKAPLYFKHIGLYSYTKDFLFVYKNLLLSKLESSEKLEQLRVLEEGFKIKVIETKFDTLGIDTPEDLVKVEEYLKKQAV